VLRIEETFDALDNASVGRTQYSNYEENAGQVQITILVRRLVNRGAEDEVQDGGWLPACDIQSDCICALETEAAAQIIDVKCVVDVEETCSPHDDCNLALLSGA
jgi:hypothetical protein